ncbi:hypothetical protein [Clostridium sp. BL-8]|uniref:hypothetical protein n=1 Tax=Clostridium sp. BL-8 TaxID=349938 RepID=UPI00098CCD6D|nr:hypothetical protein [Clostridium sp. BL-8]OOM77075.1 hypothetical protein CLOBL_31680 [Clostridium sp. BL-8]
MNYLQTQNLSQLFVVILLLAYTIYKQVILRPVKPKKYVILPIIFLYLTFNAMANLSPNIIYKEAAPLFLLASIGLISGIASGMVTKIFTGEDGILYQQGGIAAAIVLFFTIPIRYILRHSLISTSEFVVLNNAGVSYLIMFSSQLISRSLTIFIRCPMIWSLFLDQRKNRRKKIS